MKRAGSKRGGCAAGAGPAARSNDALIDSGIATLERATSMDRLGQLEGGPCTTPKPLLLYVIDIYEHMMASAADLHDSSAE